MKTLKKIILFAFISAIVVSCKKEQITPGGIEGQPVFSFSGNIGGNPVNLQAGVNNYYMYSSYTDTNNVYKFIGTLKSTATGANSIQIIINDYKVSAPNAPAVIDSALSPAVHYFYNIPGGSIDTTGYSVTFTPVIYAGYANAYTYSFGDGSTSSAVAPTHIYKTANNYNTSLTIAFSGCGPESMFNIFGVAKQSNPPVINSITSTVISKSNDTARIKLTATVTGGALPLVYSWVLGDGNTSAHIIDTDTYIDSGYSHHTYACTLNVKDALGKTATYNYTIADTADSSICRFDYSMSIPHPIVDTNILSLSNIIISYTDASGKVYTSKNKSQPLTSNFHINSVSDYKSNLNNQATKMLKVTFSCMLYPVSGGAPISANNCTAIIAVAYK